MDIRMIATDLDGTVIPIGGTAPPFALDILAEAARQGICVVPATGRTLTALPAEILGLSGIRYIISGNGAAVTDRVCGQRIYENLIPYEAAAQILEILVRYPVYTCVYMGDQPYNWEEIPDFLEKYYRNMSFFGRNPQRDLIASVRERKMNVEKIFVAVPDPEERRRLRTKLSGLPGIQITSSSPRNLEFNRENASKGTALAWLGEHLGIGPEYTLAMGDNENDHSMLRYAGISLTPENGTEETKRLAGYIVPDAAEGGPVLFVREHALKREEQG